MRELSFTNSFPEDALSCILETIHMKVVTAQASDFIPPWDLKVQSGLPGFYFVTNGRCCIQLDGTNETWTLGSGELILLLQRKAHSLRDGQGNVSPLESDRHMDVSEKITPVATTLVRGAFTWNEKEIASLLPEMPPVIHIKSDDGRLIPWMIRTIKMIADESASDQPGARAIINHLAYVILVQGIRAYLAAIPPDGGRALEFMNHRQISPALYLMSAHPEEPWSLASLSRKCGMSRSAFAEEFKRATGRSPMAYLLDLRMNRACDLLGKGFLRIKEVSEQAGYGSQPAFSNAFRRWTGVAPGAYRKTQRKSYS